MQSLNKKGFSSILQVIILSALSIISLSLIWGYVSDLSNSLGNQLSPAVDCINQQSQVISACINSQGKIQLDIQEALEEKISNLNVNVGGESFSCDSSCQSCSILSSENSRKTIYLSTQNPNPPSLIASINGCAVEQITISQC